METLTKENGTVKKTFRSGQGVKAQRYWKDAAHWYWIRSEYDLVTIHIGGKSASIDRVAFENVKSYIIEMIISEYKHNFVESTKDEFEGAYKKALKIINQ